MDFLSGFFAVIGAFFGFGTTEPEELVVPEPPAIVEEISMDEVVEETVSDDDQYPFESEISLGSEAAEEALDIVSEGDADPDMDMMGSQPSYSEVAESSEVAADVRTMIVAGGCFWCVEADLEKTDGVIEAVSGYSGGSTDNPTYDDYGKGGHREVVEVTYDANKVSFEDILIITMKTTDPTDDDGTFADRGDKYSSAFYYETDEQKEIIDSLIAEVDEYGPYDKPLAIDVEERAEFWAAEDFHQNYYSGTFSKLKYGYYRSASGRDDLIIKYWGVNDHSPELSWRNEEVSSSNKVYMWTNYVKPSADELKEALSDIEYKVTQKDGTERAGTSDLDKNWEPGVYVDILSGEPLYSSKDKFDSGTGWPSFVKPITDDSLTLHEDRKLFSVRTETRSAIADNHIGHVFNDGPDDRGGMRYCMNGVALKFIALADMESGGYGDFVQYVQ